MLKYLYWFSSDSHDLIEVKRLDLESAPLSKVYKWLLIPRSSSAVWELDFKSMDRTPEKEFRQFVEGFLEFDATQATLKIFGSVFTFETRDPETIPAQTRALIQSHLRADYESSPLFAFRRLKPSDLQEFKHWIADPEVIRYSMTKFHLMSTEEQIRNWFVLTLNDTKTFQLGIIDPATDAIIGYAGVAALNTVDRNGEYFILIGDKSFWGKGIASGVTKAIVRLGFEELGLHRIFLTASDKNTGALRAYEKAGFKHEGRMREAFFRNSEYSDKVFMGILKSEYFQ